MTEEAELVGRSGETARVELLEDVEELYIWRHSLEVIIDGDAPASRIN